MIYTIAKKLLLVSQILKLTDLAFEPSCNVNIFLRWRGVGPANLEDISGILSEGSWESLGNSQGLFFFRSEAVLDIMYFLILPWS